eukprot:366071-Chlamydomonas_euryale.AAC.9
MARFEHRVALAGFSALGGMSLPWCGPVAGGGVTLTNGDPDTVLARQSAAFVTADVQMDDMSQRLQTSWMDGMFGMLRDSHKQYERRQADMEDAEVGAEPRRGRGMWQVK